MRFLGFVGIMRRSLIICRYISLCVKSPERMVFENQTGYLWKEIEGQYFVLWFLRFWEISSYLFLVLLQEILLELFSVRVFFFLA